MKPIICAIDQGTTGSTVLFVDTDLQILGKKTVDFEQHFPKPGWVEHRLETIWTSVLHALEQGLRDFQIEASRVCCIGITNQRETTAVWNRKTGRPYYPAIVWQDRRTEAACERLKQEGLEPTIHSKTGLLCDPYFSSTKMAWLFHHVPELRTHASMGQVALGTMDSYLVWQLTRGQHFKTDMSNASRTSLYHLVQKKWDPDLLALFDIPLHVLPEVVSSSGILGHTRGVLGLPDGIPISGIAGDQQAALFGQACFHAGDAKCTYGTGAFLLMNTGDSPIFSTHGLLSSIGWTVGQDTAYVLEGSVFMAGAIIQWLRDGLGLIQKASDIEAMANTVTSSETVCLIPAFTGLGAPYWKPQLKAQLLGLTRGTHKGHIARAALESIALQVVDVYEAMAKDAQMAIRSFRVDGGATENDLLMQIQADVLQCPIQRPALIESTAFGAACLAGLGIGLWPDWGTLSQKMTAQKTFIPQIDMTTRNARLSAWHAHIQKAIQCLD